MITSSVPARKDPLQTPDDPRKPRIDDLKQAIRKDPAFKYLSDRICSLIDALVEEQTHAECSVESDSERTRNDFGQLDCAERPDQIETCVHAYE